MAGMGNRGGNQGHQGRGGGRGGNRGSGRGGNRGPFSGGLYDPSQTLTGRPLHRAAVGIANAQVKGPLHELAAQIARNNRQGQVAGQRTFGYYMQLAQEAKDSLAQEQAIGQGLNTQLQGIGQQSQQQLAQFGQNAQQSGLSGLAGMGLDAGQTAAMKAEQARQQGLSTLNAQAFRSAGANQGANYSSNAASSLGTFGLRGQERLGDLAKATALSNAPLSDKQAALIASKGALTATALGQLRSQERNYQIAQQGLGLKGQALKVTAANDRARNALTLNDQQLRAKIAGINAKLASSRLSETKRHNLQTEKTAAQRALHSGSGGSGGGSGGQRPLTANEQSTWYRGLGTVSTLIHDGQQHGLTPAQIKANLQSGQNPSKRTYDPLMIEAAYELLGWGHILPRTARAMRNQGLRGGYWRGGPIRVGQAPTSPQAQGQGPGHQ